MPLGLQAPAPTKAHRESNQFKSLTGTSLALALGSGLKPDPDPLKPDPDPLKPDPLKPDPLKPDPDPEPDPDLAMGHC